MTATVYWLTPSETETLKTYINRSSERSLELEEIFYELKVAEIRAETVDLPIVKMRAALGLEPGSNPYWLSLDEQKLIETILKKE